MAGRPDVLVVSALRPDQMGQLEAAYRLHRYDEAEDQDAFLNGRAAAIRAVVTTGGKGFQADLLAKLPNLELVGSSGVGTDAIDLDACRARGVPVTNTPDVLNDDVADIGIGLIIAALRQMPQGHAYVKSGDWGRKGMMPLTTTLSGKTLGIVGLGRIGREVADRARALKMRITYTGRTRQVGMIVVGHVLPGPPGIGDAHLQRPRPVGDLAADAAEADDAEGLARERRRQVHHAAPAQSPDVT